MKQRVAIYARVSTADQHCEMQLRELGELAQRMGWEAFEYVDHGLSGKAGVRRPSLERLLADARMRKFDIVVVWKLDRFGRSLKNIVENVQHLTAAGVRFYVPSQSIDTDKHSPMGQFILHIFAAFAELERALTVERVASGLASYRKAHEAGQVGKGKSRESRSKKNLPVGRPRKIVDRTRAKEMRDAGKSIRAIARALGVGKGTVERMIAV